MCNTAQYGARAGISQKDSVRLSLQGTLHHLNNFIPELLAATSTQRYQIYRTLERLRIYVNESFSRENLVTGGS
jgi:hypothetical protein